MNWISVVSCCLHSHLYNPLQHLWWIEQQHFFYTELAYFSVAICVSHGKYSGSFELVTVELSVQSSLQSTFSCIDRIFITSRFCLCFMLLDTKSRIWLLWRNQEWEGKVTLLPLHPYLSERKITMWKTAQQPKTLQDNTSESNIHHLHLPLLHWQARSAVVTLKRRDKAAALCLNFYVIHLWCLSAESQVKYFFCRNDTCFVCLRKQYSM